VDSNGIATVDMDSVEEAARLTDKEVDEILSALTKT